VIFVVCHDELSRLVMERLNIEQVIVVPIHDIEHHDASLLAAKHTRTKVEYYWTTTASIILRLLDRHPEIDTLAYVDADLLFYSDPQPIFDELASGSVLIHEHRFSPSVRYLEPQSGRFNVGLMLFRNDPKGRQVLSWWRERCIEWCYLRFENGKIGDQGYLTDWPTRFPGIVVLCHVGAGVAPWNHDQYLLGYDANGVPRIDELPLIFYHYHAFSLLSDDACVPFRHTHYPSSPEIVLFFFPPYMAALDLAVERIRQIIPDFSYGIDADLDVSERAVLRRTTNGIAAVQGHVSVGGSAGFELYLPGRAIVEPPKPVPPPPRLTLAKGEPLRAFLARPQIAGQVRTLYFIGCHTFHERDWFFNTFRNLENLYLFEPLPNVRSQLEQDFAGHPVVKVFPYAISDHDGQAIFHVTNNLQSSSLLNMKEHKQLFPGVDAIADIAVPKRRLESVIREHGLVDPDLLFIDVQGAEYQVLNGIERERLDRVKIIFTEASTIEVYEGAKLLSDLNDFLGTAFHFIGFEDMLNSKVHGDALYLNHDLDTTLPQPQIQAKTLCAEAHAAWEAGDLPAAMLGFISAIELDPANLDALNHLALISWGQGKTAEAMQLIEHAHSIAPDDHDTVHNFVRLSTAAGQTERAQDTLAAYLVQHPEEPTPASVPSVAQKPERTSEYRITALVSTYNSEDFIEECLEDLIGQTIADQIEIFVLDAASPQNEKAVVERFQKTHPNIRYLRTPERIGVYAAWNIMVREARGEYLISCSTNDRLATTSCEILADYLDAHQEIALVYGNCFLVDTPHQDFETPVITDAYLWPPYSYAMLTRQCLVGPHPMWRRSLHDELGYFDESYKAIGDQDFWLRVGYGQELKNLSVFTGLYYVDSKGLSRDTSIAPDEIRRVHTTHLPERMRRSVRKSAPAIASPLPSEVELTRFLIIMLVTKGEEICVADSMDTLLKQSHAAWQLVVISDQECPDATLFRSHPHLSWEPLAGRGLHGAALEILAASEADWVILAEPGLAFSADALRGFAVASMQHPSWHLIYSDDADSEPNGNIRNPRHKPEFCLELLHRIPYLDNFAVRKATLLGVGGVGECILAENFDIALRVHDQEGALAIGHIAEVLLRKPSDKRRPFHIDAGKAALRSHFQRQDNADRDEDMSQRLLAGPYAKAFELLGENSANPGDPSQQNPSTELQDFYALWQLGHSYLKRDALWIAERLDAMTSKPRFHLAVITLPGRENALANNIKSLGHQFYQEWHLTILSTESVHPALVDTPSITWLQLPCEQHLAAANRALLEMEADWVGMYEAGDKLAPHALFSFADKSEKHPEYQVLFSDEDRVDTEDVHSTPFFKTDFNLEMLRAAPFVVGGLLFLKHELFADLNGFDVDLEGVEAFDLTLRAWEKVGLAGIGHIADVLYHRYSEGGHSLLGAGAVADAHQHALKAHLARCGLRAELQDGLLPGSFHVRYLVNGNPLVSILIPTKNQTELIKRCLTSLIEGTGYSNCEIFVLDNGSDEPEAIAYLNELKALNSPRLKVLDCNDPFNLSAIINRGAREASGEYLMLLTNDTAVLHEEWLEEMLGIAQQVDVGAVGAKLFTSGSQIQHAGVVLGINDAPAEYPFQGNQGESDGYFGRLNLTQEYSAVSAGCLLVNRALYLELGGLDEQQFPMSCNDVDFCQRLRHKGFRNVFTPHARLLREAKISAKSESEDKSKEAKLVPQAEEIDRFYDIWRHDVAFDPFFNRNLSTHGRDFLIEVAPALTWDPEWRPRPRVLAHPADRTGCGEYRVVSPMRALNDAGRLMGWETGNYLTPPELFRMEPDSILFQRQVDPHQLELMERYVRHSKAFRIYEIDDLITNIPIRSIRKKQFVEQKDLHKRFRKGIALCDRFIVSTEFLAEEYKGYVDDIVVVPNYIERRRWGELRPKRRNARKPRVGWAGSITHDGDLAIIIDMVKATAMEVDWVFFGMCPNEIRAYVAEYHEGVILEDYAPKLASLDLDLAVAPLEDVPFNHGKSHLRLLEYGVLGYPVICTDITPYRGDYPVTRVANKFKDWVDAIRSHVADRDELARRGDALRDYINANWILEDNLDVWVKAWLP
jgi:FkbM family methyltransferase